MVKKDSVVSSELEDKNNNMVSPSNAAMKDEDEDRLITRNFKS